MDTLLCLFGVRIREVRLYSRLKSSYLNATPCLKPDETAFMFDIRTFDYVRLFKSVRLPNVRLCLIGRKNLGGFTKPNRQVNRTIGVRPRPGVLAI